MDQIKLVVPCERKYFEAAGEFFRKLSDTGEGTAQREHPLVEAGLAGGESARIPQTSTDHEKLAEMGGVGSIGGDRAPEYIPDVPETHNTASEAIEVDADGLPWDERIHSSNYKKLAKTGCWQKRRGVDPILVTTVETELMILMGLTADEKPESAPPPLADEKPESAPPPPADEKPESAPPPPPASGPITTFPELAKAIREAKIPQETVNETLAVFEINGLAFVVAKAKDDPALIPTIAAALGL